ncbi:hypothetical protein A3K70_04645 [Candidatus Bathyarchaeota archaeon RBG_16_48_13]|nr:MAG: hypothetical protein A3K70_04645 [Candidatus Bathyarchaeota archaeon RBG_16_48_13]
MDYNALVTFLLALSGGLGAGLLSYAISRLVAPPKHSTIKEARFEAGNPPSKRGRGWFTMQYYAYLVVFLTVEPIFFYLFLLLMETHEMYYSVVQLFVLIMLMLAPPLVFGLDAANRIELWKIKERKER